MHTTTDVPFGVKCTSKQAQRANDNGMTAQEMYIRALMQAFHVPDEQSHSYTAAHTAVDALRTDIIDADKIAEDADEEVILCYTPIVFHNIYLKRCCAVKLYCLHCTSLKSWYQLLQ
jgi:hypothetical protein